MASIVFLCSSLEAGRDGVGDYVRLLGEELIKKGHIISAIALNDRHISYEYEEFQGSLSALRLPSTLNVKKRFERAQKWIDKIDPQWLSLQFVPFGFQKKGLPLKLGTSLKTLGKGRNWHIMFHELWVGMEREAPFKHIAWGWLQKKLIHSLVIKLNPSIVHTQTNLYLFYLRNLGVDARYLSLPSNIPISDNHDIQLSNELKFNNNDNVTFVIFGSLHHSAPVFEFVEELLIYTKQNKVAADLIFIGRNNNEQENWAAIWKNNGLQVTNLGEQSSEQISNVLSNASFGISTTPFALIEKSGAVAAMRTHGLPVICVSRNWRSRVDLPPLSLNGFVEYKPGNLQSCLAINNSRPYGYTISEVAKQFADSILSIS